MNDNHQEKIESTPPLPPETKELPVEHKEEIVDAPSEETE